MAVSASDATLAGGQESFADYHCRGTTTRAQAVLSAFNPSAAKGLVRALSEFRPDVVHVKMFLWQLSPSILRHLVGRPSVYEIMTYKAICPNGKKILHGGRRCTHPAGTACLSEGCLTPQSWLAMMFQRHLWMKRRNAFSRLVAVSETVRLRLDENGVGPCRVIPFGCPERPSRGELSPTPLLAFAGRLEPEKGVMTLLRAMTKVRETFPDALLLIAGDGSERSPLERFARESGLQGNVRFAGNLSRGDLEEAFDPAWVQVVPSTWEEPFGIVTIEAMMRGTAVIASDHGGCAECVRENVTGLSTPSGDANALAAAIGRLLADKTLCDEFGRAGREIAREAYTLTAYVDAWENYCRDMIAMPRAGTGS